MRELINVNQLGVAQGTALEEAVNAEFRGETMEVGLYLAMARQAQREGYPEVAQVLRQLAIEEAEHAAHFAELNGKISTSTRDNISKMLQGELAANKCKREAAVQAKEANLDQVHDFMDESSRDEARHAQALAGMLQRYFKLSESGVRNQE